METCVKRGWLYRHTSSDLIAQLVAHLAFISQGAIAGSNFLPVHSQALGPSLHSQSFTAKSATSPNAHAEPDMGKISTGSPVRQGYRR